MVMFNNREHTAIPRIDRPIAITILIEQTNVLKDVPLLIVRLENCFVLVDLTKRCAHGIAVEITTAALKLMPPKELKPLEMLEHQKLVTACSGS